MPISEGYIKCSIFKYIKRTAEQRKKYPYTFPYLIKHLTVLKIPIEINDEKKLVQFLADNFESGIYSGIGWQLRKDKTGKTRLMWSKHKLFKIEFKAKDGKVIDHYIHDIKGLKHYKFFQTKK